MEPNKMSTEEQDNVLSQIEQNKATNLNRAERRARIKYFSKMLSDLQKNKPKFDLTLEGEEAAEQTYKLRAYIVTEGNLKRKIHELKTKS